MKCFVMKTKQYDEDAKKYCCVQVYNRFKHEVERISNYEHPTDAEYSFGNYIRKRHQNFRTIFQYKNFKIDGQDIRCYVALRVFARGGQEYADFTSRHTSDEDRYRLVGAKNAEWDKYVAEIEELVKSGETVEVLPMLSTDENNYIQRSGGLTHEIFDTKLIESKYWVETVRNGVFKDFCKVGEALQDIMLQATEEDHYGLIEGSYGEKGMKFLCARPRDCGDCWYFLKIGNEEQIEEFKKEMDLSDETPAKKLDNISCRAYPYTMMEGDLDFWMEMETDENSNFILSAEELRIVSGELVFPLFLTGRAGSGKSTMLQYLFAEYFLRYLEFTNINPPVYLSYSSNLIDNAKKLATNLFTKNHAYVRKLNELHKDFDKDIQPHFETSFYVFQNLVKKFIDDSVPGKVQSRFSPNRHITYVKFREKWIRKFNRNPAAYQKFGPAISWHVIRTYIKGWNAESYLSPELYKDIGKSNKSVSDEVFTTVYDEVWEKWYSKLQEDEEVWDDQDLVRYCLAPDDDSCETCVSDKFSAIFCDESQDFTRTEIDFILRISIFSKRRFYGENTLYQLPFVFAGDEFQTLNPTGFSWSSLRSYFTTQLMSSKSAPEPKVLIQNYRSPAPVTKLANRLQLLSQTRCRKDEKYTPQIPHHLQDRQDPVLCLSPDNPLVWKKLSSVGAVLIIPCSEGQSPKEFIEKSDIKEHFEFYEDGSAKNITIINPSQAKGLEYPNVAIYGFDYLKDLSIQSLMNWYTSDNHETENESKEIEIKYFLSNAYVSATRATSRLFIVSDFSDKSFWSFAFSSEDQILNNKVEKISEKMIQMAKWNNDSFSTDKELLGYILKGDIDAITHDSFLNIEELAMSTKQRAMELSDAGLMRQAAARFREQGRDDEVILCNAYASRFDGDYRNAALNFEKIQLYNEALNDYWTMGSEENGSIKEVLEYINGLGYKIRDLRVTLSEHALKKKVSLNDFKLDLSELWNYLDKGSESIHESFEPYMWQETINIILKNIPMDKQLNKNDINPILELSDKLESKYSVEVSKDILALLAFKINDYGRACAIWDKMKTRPKEYYRAKCSLLPYPDNLVYREQTGEKTWMKSVIEDYNANKKVKLENYQHKIVSRSFVSCGNRDEVIDNLAYLWTNANDINECNNYSEIARENSFKYAEDCINALNIYRFVDINSVRTSKTSYVSKDLNLLMQTLQKIKIIRSHDFLAKIDNILKYQETTGRDSPKNINGFFNFLDNEFKTFYMSKWNWLILFEIGAVMERREYFFDSQLYYEWAQKQTSDLDLKVEMGIRWIICRFGQAKKARSDDLLDKAMEKAREIGVSMDPNGEYSPEPKFNNWKYIYREVLNTPCGKQKQVQKKDASVKPDGKNVNERNNTPVIMTNPKKFTDGKENISALVGIKPNSGLFSSSNGLNGDDLFNPGIRIDGPNINLDVSKSKPIIVKPIPADTIAKGDFKKDVMKLKRQNGDHKETYSENKECKAVIYDYEIRQYKFRYNPQKGELSISLETENEDLSVKIKKGFFPKEADFSVSGNGRLIKTEDNSETPFEYISDDKCIRIIDADSRMEMCFPLGSAKSGE